MDEDTGADSGRKRSHFWERTRGPRNREHWGWMGGWKGFVLAEGRTWGDRDRASSRSLGAMRSHCRVLS